MKVKVLHAFYATETGVQRAEAVLEVPEAVAERLIAEKHVEAVQEPKKKNPEQTEATLKETKTKKT